MKLDFYYARRFLQWFAIISGVLLSLMILIDLNEQSRRFEGHDVSFGNIIELSLLKAPASLTEFLPLIIILSTVVLFVSMARSSELVVTRAIGRSGIRALAAPLLVAAVIGVLAATMLNPIAAATLNRHNTLSDKYRGNGDSVLSFSGDGLWLRQGGEEGQSVIHALTHTTSDDSITLRGVNFISYARGIGPVRRIAADSASLTGDHWVLQNAKVWPLGRDLNPEVSSTTHEELELPTTLTQDRIRDSLGAVAGISIYDLPETIRGLEEAGFSTRRFEVLFQAELARPLFLIAMVLVGAAFSMRHARFGGTGIAVLMAVLLGFSLYFVRNFAQILGENGQIPVLLAAWAPPAASILLTIGLLLHAEDG
jgi:lipopolysaccharide export system permease protein